MGLYPQFILKFFPQFIQKVKSVKLFAWLFGFTAIVIFGQQCAKVDLEFYKSNDPTVHEQSQSVFVVTDPSDYPIVERVVILLDMSYSMVSGPCHHDVDSPNFTNRSIFTSDLAPYDPNECSAAIVPICRTVMMQNPGEERQKLGNHEDARLAALDCAIDETLPFGATTNIFQATGIPPILKTDLPTTYKGIDHSGARFTLLREWIQQLQKSPLPPGTNPSDYSTKLMIVPFTGGKAKETISKAINNLGLSKYAFYDPLAADDLGKINTLIAELENIHNTERVNNSLDERFNSFSTYGYFDKKMGTSSLGEDYRELYVPIIKELKTLRNEKRLFRSTLKIIHLTDGRLTPIKSHIDDVLNNLKFQPPGKAVATCSECTRPGGICPTDCEELRQDMISSWGNPIYQEPARLALYMASLMAIPHTVGGGQIKTHFVEILPPTGSSSSLSAPPPFWKDSAKYFEFINYLVENKSRFEFNIMDAARGGPSNDLSDLTLKHEVIAAPRYQVSEIFVLNQNAHLNRNGDLELDSSGGGASDAWQLKTWGQVYTSARGRSGGWCLNAIIASPELAVYCRNLIASQGCDQYWDGDGDGLNECEEKILGTNPYQFDTDGDHVPDLIEFLYGMNPLYADAKQDFFADGITNLQKIAMGAMPQTQVNNISNQFFMSYRMDSLGYVESRNRLGNTVWTENKSITLLNIPTALPASPPLNPFQYDKLFITKSDGTIGDEITPDSQLFSVATKPNTNILTVLVRMVEANNNKKVHWTLKKIPLQLPLSEALPQIDLTDLQMIRTLEQEN